MKKFIYGFVLGLLALFGTAAVADYTIKDGGGSTQTVLAFVCATTKICPAHVLIKSDGTEIGTNSNPVYTNIVSSAVGATAGTTSIGALGQMVNCAATTSPSGQTTGNQSYLNCDTNGNLRVVNPLVTHVSGGSASLTSLVGKASAGNLYAFNCTAVSGAAAGFCIAYNGTSAPGTGALTAGNVLDFCYIDTTARGCSLSRIPMAAAYSTGIVILVSSASTPYTYTTGTLTAAITVDVQ